VSVEDCQYRDDHPRLDANLEEIDRKVDELARRLNSVEGTMNVANRERVTDLKEFTDKLGDVHEKVNSVALKLAGLDGRIIGAMIAGSAAASVIGFVLSRFMKG
jgi:DNA-binding ferritin-like protein